MTLWLLKHTWAKKELRLLKLEGVQTHYGRIEILKFIDIEVEKGEIVCLLGGNASGKSTTMKTILGIVRPTKGKVVFKGKVINDLSTPERIKMGLATVPENRRLFPRLTVRENLEMGAYTRQDVQGIEEDFEQVMEVFPQLKERLNQLAGTLSGGEQQMVAVGRALMSQPELVVMDEPSMGLAPALVDQSFEIIKEINQRGVTIFMVEQNAHAALSIADRGYVLQSGRIVMKGPAPELIKSDEIRKAYLGEV